MMSKWTSRDWDNSFESFQGILEVLIAIALVLAHCVVKLTKYRKQVIPSHIGSKAIAIKASFLGGSGNLRYLVTKYRKPTKKPQTCCQVAIRVTMMSKWMSRDWDKSFASFQGILEALIAIALPLAHM